MPSSKFYDDNEAEEILHLALRDSADSGAMTRERLLATASELGISEEAIVRAEQELARRKETTEREKSDQALFAEYKSYHRGRVFSGLGSWASTSILLLGINFLTSGGINWSIWPVGIWGLVEVGHVLEALFSPPSKGEKFERWKRKRLKRAEAESPN
jgi:hypothetical protein